jgi:plastocyanin
MASGRIPAILLVGAAALAAASGRPSAQGGQPAGVSGRVEIGIPISTRRPANIYTRSVPGARLAPTSELRNVVVYLQDAPTRAVTPVRASIRQEHETFTPRVVAVPVGSTVDFPNDDPIYHNVFSLSRAKNFNLGRYPRGETRRVRFDRPGVVKVFCEIHSHMSATVMVFDHPWFAVPAEDGRFQLPPAPAGNHQITAWHERLGDTTINVRLEAGRPLETDFTLPVPEKGSDTPVR